MDSGTVGTGERRPNRWSWGALTALAVGVTAALTSGHGPQRADAQSVRAVRAAEYTYRQSNVLWTRISETLNEWEGKGWEPFQVVPIANPNPGTGGAMQVAIIFRRPAKTADR